MNAGEEKAALQDQHVPGGAGGAVFRHQLRHLLAQARQVLGPQEQARVLVGDALEQLLADRVPVVGEQRAGAAAGPPAGLAAVAVSCLPIVFGPIAIWLGYSANKDGNPTGRTAMIVAITRALPSELFAGGEPGEAE